MERSLLVVVAPLAVDLVLVSVHLFCGPLDVLRQSRNGPVKKKKSKHICVTVIIIGIGDDYPDFAPTPQAYSISEHTTPGRPYKSKKKRDGKSAEMHNHHGWLVVCGATQHALWRAQGQPAGKRAPAYTEPPLRQSPPIRT